MRAHFNDDLDKDDEVVEKKCSKNDDGEDDGDEDINDDGDHDDNDDSDDDGDKKNLKIMAMIYIE